MVPFKDMNSWEAQVPAVLKTDVLWSATVHRMALFCTDIAWYDVKKLIGDKRTKSLADQLYRSVGSISANFAEGYSRQSHRDRARFFEYALGSAREARDWYYKSRHVLGEEITDHRLHLLTAIIKQLITIVPSERKSSVKEPEPSYLTLTNLENNTQEDIQLLSQIIPFPK